MRPFTHTTHTVPIAAPLWNPRNKTLLVAVNGQESGWRALDWAAVEAAVTGAALRIVHVVSWPPLQPDMLIDVPTAGSETDGLDHGQRVLDAARARAHTLAPDIATSTHLDIGSVASTIRAAGRCDSLVVIGRGRTHRAQIASIESRIIRRSHSPVVVVSLADERPAGPSTGRVVLVVDDATDVSAIRYAIQAATRRDVGLTIVHTIGRSTPFTARPDSRRNPLTEPHYPQHCRLPNIDIRYLHVGQRDTTALLAETRSAALVVVGTTSHKWSRRNSIGTTGRAVLRWASEPVAVIRPPHTGTTDRTRHESTPMARPPAPQHRTD